METIMKMRFLFPGRSVSWPLAIRNWLLFRCWKTKKLGKKKMDSSDKTEKNCGWNKSKLTGLFTLPSAMASSLASPSWNAPGKWNHWGLLHVSEKNNVCSRCSQVQHFPLTRKRVQMLSFDKTGMPTSLLDFFSRIPQPKTLQHRSPSRLPCPSCFAWCSPRLDSPRLFTPHRRLRP